MTVSNMRYSLIREMDVSNGQGVGISLFVQGCHFHCKGCFNQETWDFNGGKEWTEDIEDKFIKLANRPYIKRISFLGGEPLADENVPTVLRIIKKLKLLYPEKKIWIFTGYTWDSIINGSNISRISAVNFADVVADGQFQIENQDINNKQILWVGSTNQRVIDVAKTIESNKIITIEKDNYNGNN